MYNKESEMAYYRKEEEFSQLFKQTYRLLYAYAVTLGCSDDNAKDVIQDCFMKLWYNYEKIEKIDNIKQYLLRMVHNRYMDMIKVDKRIDCCSVDSVSHRAEMIGSINVADDDMFFTQMNTRFMDEVMKLPLQCRKIFVMHRFSAMSYMEIAQVMQIAHSTVKNQMSIAMRKLYTALKDDINQ